MKMLITRITRGKSGQVTRVDETLEADSIRIGRGTDCKLHLPDPRVALHHATVRCEVAGRCSIEADGGVLLIDGITERASLLKPAQRIRMGPYEIEIAQTPVSADIALTLELLEPLADVLSVHPPDVQRSLAQTWLSKRLLSWGVAGTILLAFLVWPVMHALEHDPQPKSSKAMSADASWDPGTLDSGHATFGRDCGQCHQTPFVQVKNESCENCHKTIGWHFALDTPAARTLHDSVFGADESLGRCAACHRDHKGIHALKRQDSPLCINCHQDLKSRHPGVAFANVTDLKTDHPTFKLSMLVAGKTGSAAVVRVPQSDKTQLIEKSNLKFPHDVHLSPKGVRSPAGKQKLECKNCHTPDETATRFKPINMKAHCQDCHSLEFEPKATSRQVPHGNVADAIATVNEFYAQAALFGTPIDQAEPGRTRGGSTTASGPMKNIDWVNRKARTIITEMMEKRACFTCHEITPAGTGDQRSWTIAPIAITDHWLPKSRFAHHQHGTFDCKKCHDVVQSKSSSDIAIPDLANCKSCHSGNAIEQDKAVGTCATCHSFHIGEAGSGKPEVLPKTKVNANELASK